MRVALEQKRGAMAVTSQLALKRLRLAMPNTEIEVGEGGGSGPLLPLLMPLSHMKETPNRGFRFDVRDWNGCAGVAVNPIWLKARFFYGGFIPDSPPPFP